MEQVLARADVVFTDVLRKVAPSFGCHGPHAEAPAQTYIFIKEVSTFHVHGRGRAERDVQIQILKVLLVCLVKQVFDSKGKIVGTQPEAHIDTEECGTVAGLREIVSQQTFLFEDDIAQGIAQFCGEDADTGS